MRKSLIHYQRTHMESRTLCQQHSSVSELHILQEQPWHSRCSSSMILPGGQMLPGEAVSCPQHPCAPCRISQCLHVRSRCCWQCLIPTPDSVLGAGTGAWLCSRCGQTLFLAACCG